MLASLGDKLMNIRVGGQTTSYLRAKEQAGRRPRDFEAVLTSSLDVFFFFFFTLCTLPCLKSIISEPRSRSSVTSDRRALFRDYVYNYHCIALDGSIDGLNSVFCNWSGLLTEVSLDLLNEPFSGVDVYIVVLKIDTQHAFFIPDP